MLSSQLHLAQLELELGDRRVRIPWEGTLPRALTRCAQSFIFKAQAAKGRPQINSGDQFDMWLPTKKAPQLYRGAPLLLPFK